MQVRKGVLFLMVVILLFILIGCGTDTKNTVASLSDENIIEIVDCVGRKVSVPKEPEHVACLFAVSSHIVSMLGDSEKIVAVSEGNKRDHLFLEIYPAIKDVRTPKGSGHVNIEELFKDPAPDVVFCYTDLVQDDKMMNKIERFGVPVVVIDFKTIEEHQYAVNLIGKIMNKEEKAQAYNKFYNRVLEKVTEKVSNIPESEKKFVYHAINELLRTDTQGSLPADWIPKTGVLPVGVAKGITTTGADKNFLSLEQLFTYDPEHIMINGKDVMDYIEQKERLHVLQAYQNGHIYLMPLGVSRWGHPYSIETPLAILWTAKTIYPEHFENIDIEQETMFFYNEFFEYELTEDMTQKIIEGRTFKEIMGGRK